MTAQVVSFLAHPALTPERCLATHGRWMRNAERAPVTSNEPRVLTIGACVDRAIMWRKASEQKRLGR